ncbi:MAG: MaoC family dehydratase N-terminal domain-containing protein [Anaerolineae bacterium]|nr:MaoC family dehydratase N-terminal domain-containing protein [Anaerolineae bacterium]
MLEPSHKGKTFPPFTYTIERSKLREFLLAVGEDDPAYDAGDPPLPPTFPTLFAFWSGSGLEGVLAQVGVEIYNVLHSEQEYEYLAPIHIGDTVEGQAAITNIYQKAGMDFMEIVTDYKNQAGVPVLKDRALIIVRGEGG